MKSMNNEISRMIRDILQPRNRQMEEILFLNVEARLELFVSEFMFKNIMNNTSVTSVLVKWFQRKHHSRNLRDTKLITIPKMNTVFGQSAPFYRMIKIWNNLPHQIRGLETFQEFDEKLRTYLIEKKLVVTN